MGPKKWELFIIAINMFADKGYAGVGVREIAAAANIKSASLYNHFADKEALLQRMYQFFDEYYLAARPAVGEVLDLIPTVHPHEVLERSLPQITDASVHDMLKKIFLIALKERDNDKRAKKIVMGVLEESAERFATILEKMVQAGVIEPLDVEKVAGIFARFDSSVALPIDGKREGSFANWQEKRKVLFGLARVRGV